VSLLTEKAGMAHYFFLAVPTIYHDLVIYSKYYKVSISGTGNKRAPYIHEITPAQ